MCRVAWNKSIDCLIDSHAVGRDLSQTFSSVWSVSVIVWLVAVRDTFCSYGVMELCTRGLGTSISTLRARGVNLSSVRILCVIAEERPRIQLTTSFSKLFSALGLSPRVVSTSFGCRVNTGICLQVWSSLHPAEPRSATDPLSCNCSCLFRVYHTSVFISALYQAQASNNCRIVADCSYRQRAWCRADMKTAMC